MSNSTTKARSSIERLAIRNSVLLLGAGTVLTAVLLALSSDRGREVTLLVSLNLFAESSPQAATAIVADPFKPVCVPAGEFLQRLKAKLPK